MSIADNRAVTDATVAYVNGRGGVQGRQMTPVYFQLNSAGSFDSEGQRSCSTWTEDNKVVLGIAPWGNLNYTQLGCMADRQTP